MWLFTLVSSLSESPCMLLFYEALVDIYLQHPALVGMLCLMSKQYITYIPSSF